jgi:hypothetical protein
MIHSLFLFRNSWCMLWRGNFSKNLQKTILFPNESFLKLKVDVFLAALQVCLEVESRAFLTLHIED